MDPEDLRGLLARFYAIASDVMTEHGGTLEKFIGDAAMAIFGLPHAHDDDARRALDAALALRDRLRGEAGLGEQLPIRVGLNTGEVIASRDRERNDFLVTGDPVNVAARLQQAAEPWQILASARTAIADGGAHDFGPATELELKGKAAGVEARVLLGRAHPSTAAAANAARRSCGGPGTARDGGRVAPSPSGGRTWSACSPPPEPGRAASLTSSSIGCRASRPTPRSPSRSVCPTGSA